MGEVVFLLLLGGTLGYLYTLTGSFPVSIVDKSGGAALFPVMVIGFILFCITIRIGMILFAAKREDFTIKELFQGNRLFFMAALCCYVILIPLIGYLLATLLFLAVTINGFVMKTRKEKGSSKEVLLRNLIIVAFVILITLFFTRVLGALLPTGFLGLG